MTDIEIIRTIFTEFPYALFGSVIAGSLCAYLGVFIVSRRVVFLGATLTQVAVMGIAFAHLPFVDMNPVVGSMAFTLGAMILFAKLLRSRSVPRDSVLGFSFVIAIALRILMIQKSPAAEVSEIETILKGDVLFVNAGQFVWLLVTAGIVFLIHTLFYKEFVFVSFDAETATAQGFRSDMWDLFFYLTVGVAISVATRIVGDVFVFGFLVMPALGATFLTKRVSRTFLLSIPMGAIPPVIGLYVAFKFDFPAGPTTVAMAFILMGVAFLVRRIRSW
jgi:zinc transport system permease protein